MITIFEEAARWASVVLAMFYLCVIVTKVLTLHSHEVHFSVCTFFVDVTFRYQQNFLFFLLTHMSYDGFLTVTMIIFVGRA